MHDINIHDSYFDESLAIFQFYDFESTDINDSISFKNIVFENIEFETNG